MLSDGGDEEALKRSSSLICGAVAARLKHAGPLPEVLKDAPFVEYRL